jgi:hypothetical protein
VAAEAGIDDELLLIFGLGKLEQQDLGGQVVDVGQSKADQALLELMGDDLGSRLVPQPGQVVIGGTTYLDVQRGESLLHTGMPEDVCKPSKTDCRLVPQKSRGIIDSVSVRGTWGNSSTSGDRGAELPPVTTLGAASHVDLDSVSVKERAGQSQLKCNY